MFQAEFKKETQSWTWKAIHPRTLTCPLKRDYFAREYIFQPLIFRGHVSFQGSKTWKWWKLSKIPVSLAWIFVCNRWIPTPKNTVVGPVSEPTVLGCQQGFEFALGSSKTFLNSLGGLLILLILAKRMTCSVFKMNLFCRTDLEQTLAAKTSKNEFSSKRRRFESG